MTVMYKCDTCGNTNVQEETISNNMGYRWKDEVRDIWLEIHPLIDDLDRHLCTGCMAESLRDMLVTMFPRPEGMTDDFTQSTIESGAGTDSDMSEVRVSESVPESSTLVPTRCRCTWGTRRLEVGTGSHISSYSPDCPIHGDLGFHSPG